MDWKHLAIAPRRKVATTALVYGLSLTVRFTSPTAEEASAPAAQNASPLASILFDHGWPGKPAVPAALRGRLLAPRICRAACDGPARLASLPNCAAP
jgi:hypothetical protein